MLYLLTFLEGIITFISPCLLPMLPVYIMYFSGGNTKSTKKTAQNAAFFIAGFTTLFVALGALAGIVGGFLLRYKDYVSLVSGIVLILFGLNFSGLFKIGFLAKTKSLGSDIKITGYFSSYLFGLIFSAGWTPCIGTFLSSALMKASAQASMVQGIVLLLIYSAGLGIPFFLSSILLDKFKSAFDFIKSNYKTINIIAGLFLIGYGLFLAVPAVINIAR